MSTEIKDLNVYNAGMFNSLKDKLFFINELKEIPKTFFDFGCGDGSLISVVKNLIPESCIFGYDSSDQMCDIARNKNISVYNNFDYFSDIIAVYRDKSALILSSVIHEIYSYNSETNKTIDQFWSLINSKNVKTIIVRDMMVSKSSDRCANSFIVPEKYEDLYESYCTEWGEISTQKDLIHFLLKYRYTVNWDREVKENYLPIYIEDFLRQMDESCYRLDYFCKYQLPFLSKCWKEDFNIIIPDTTHVKCIFTRK